ncbi:MAG TPA: hypothetical protein VFA28_02040 [Bryobacteraceae bacterium]|nr:hypothetical protein [Bryobacteraceae bacterium]
MLAACLCLLSAASIGWFYARGYTLYYGDAEAHLNIARRFLDSRTPGYGQVGTVWLPLPHALMLPFVMNDRLWRSGIAGAIPAGACFVFAVAALYLAARRAFHSRAAAITAAALFALNPNILYLQSIPMTETVFFAALFGMLYGTIWFRRTKSSTAVLVTALFSICASLTRYEGWFLIPFVAVFFAITARRLGPAILFGSLASLAPVYWLAHNAWYYGDPLEFYRGPYSPRAIQHGAPYPGYHNWRLAWLYFRTAAELVCGKPLVWIGALGIAAAVVRRAAWIAAFLALPAFFYIWSMHSSGGSPIYVPPLPPHSYYNSRYGTAALPLLAAGGAALVALLPPRAHALAAAVIIITAVSPWLLHPQTDAWICWKESQVNSQARRAWTAQAAASIGPSYRPGQGIFTMLGDLAGIYRQAGIPLRETLNDANGKIFDTAMIAPKALLHEQWAVAFPDDPVHRTLERAARNGPRYQLVWRIVTQGAPAVEIYRRLNADPIHESAWVEK